MRPFYESQEEIQERKQKELNEVIKQIINAEILDIGNYDSLNKKQRFPSIMRLYSKVNPSWKEDYRNIEKNKPKNLQTELSSYNIGDIIDSAENEELLEIALSVHAMNKIAHTCIYTKKRILSELINHKQRQTYGNYELSPTVFNHLEEDISGYFDPSNKDDHNTRNNSLRGIKRRGITNEDLRYLEQRGFREITAKQRMAFYIKDLLIDDLIEMLQKRDDISYGMVVKKKEDEKGKKTETSGRNKQKGKKNGKDESERKEYILVVDLPYYGQFSVHLKTHSSISALSKTPYDELRVFEIESTILTDEVSEAAEKLLKNKRLSIESLRKIRAENPRFAHYLALKQGGTKQELDALYRDTNDFGDR